jgi:hypothetical protein
MMKIKPRRKPLRRSDPVRARGRRAPVTRVAIVRSLAEARAALAEGGPVALVSPPGAAAYMGVGFFRALIEAARAEFPGVAIEAVIDCGDAAGFALSALRTGFKTVVLRGDPRARARVAAIAHSVGARVLARPPGNGTGRQGGGEKKGLTTKAPRPQDTNRKGCARGRAQRKSE